MDAKQCIGCADGSREALVAWDMDDEGTHVYTGRINDKHAGGAFAMPAFTAEEARRIAANSAGVAGLCQITEEGGAFVLDSEGDTSRVEAQPCCGLYFIGDWWTWGEVELGDLPQFTSAHLTSL